MSVIQQLEIKAGLQVLKPVTEVFETIVDPEKMKNYFISERQKRNDYHEEQVNSYYWRTYDQQEIDLVEEKNGQLSAFECKWKEQKVKVPVAFANAYPEAKYMVVHQGNYEEWVI